MKMEGKTILILQIVLCIIMCVGFIFTPNIILRVVFAIFIVKTGYAAYLRYQEIVNSK
jgi:predicted membrane chloride channel (bestrophin family)